jgi:ParB-like chromosome segregation protein Spo0J
MTKGSKHRAGKKDESVKKLHRVKIFRVPVDDIVMPAGRKWPGPGKLHGLVQSMLDIGLVTPIIVQHTNGALVLVDGLARLEAARALHWKTINCEIVTAGA